MNTAKSLSVMFFCITVAACGGGGGGGTGSGSVAIGGTVTGLTGSTVLQNNGADNLTVTADGSFTFPVSLTSGSAYNVTVLTQPSGQTCVVTGGSGTATANVTGVVVNCTNTALPAGYVSWGGLTWTPNNMPELWAAYPGLPRETDASAWCAGSSFLGHTGWRLPTQTELTGLFTSGSLDGKGYIKSYDGALYTQDWNLNWTWTSTVATSDGLSHYGVDLSTGNSGFNPNDAGTNFVTCVY